MAEAAKQGELGRPHALITGASSGIGEALAWAVAREGYAITVCARRAELLEELVRKLKEAGLTARAAALDVTQASEVARVVAEAEQALGPVELAIANAGVGMSAPAKKIRTEWIDQMVDVNLKGAMYTVCAVLPGMMERGRGHVVGVSSLAGYCGMPGSAVYCATKAGLSIFLQGLRAECKASGVRVTDICPGFIRTPLTAKNKHPMPFMMDAETAASRIVGAIRERRARYGFPWPMHAITRLLASLPVPLYDWIGGIMAKKMLPPPRPQAPPQSG